MGVKGYRMFLVAGLAALGFLAFIFNASGHKIPLSTNLAFASIGLLLLLLFYFTPRLLR